MGFEIKRHNSNIANPIRYKKERKGFIEMLNLVGFIYSLQNLFESSRKGL